MQGARACCGDMCARVACLWWHPRGPELRQQKLSPVPLQVVSKATKLDDDEGGAGAAAPEYVAEKGGATVWLASTVIFICGLIGMAFAGFLFWTVSQISLDSSATVCGHDVAMIALGSRGGRSRWCAMKGRQGR